MGASWHHDDDIGDDCWCDGQFYHQQRDPRREDFDLMLWSMRKVTPPFLAIYFSPEIIRYIWGFLRFAVPH